MSSKVDNFLGFSVNEPEDIAMSEAGFCIENQQSMVSCAIVEEVKASDATQLNCQDGIIGHEKDCYESFTENLNTSELVASRPLDQV